MAVIGSIRKRSGLLIALIGVSIIGFLLMDATNSQFGVLKGNRDALGKVNGHKISNNDYNSKYNQNLENMQSQAAQQGRQISEADKDNLQTQTWNDMVNDFILEDVYKKTGIQVTGAEMGELATGKFPHRYILQYFGNPQTGQYDPSRVKQMISNLDQTPEGTKPGEMRKQWLAFEASMKKDQLQQKYNNLISKGLTAPNWMAEVAFMDQSRTVDFRYVMLPYAEINDNDVKISDEDLKDYLNKHKARYSQDEEYRKLQYVTFPIVASAADSTATLRRLDANLADFTKGTTVSEDSVFVKVYSEQGFDEVYYTKDQVFSPVKDTLFSVPVKTVIGPYLDGGAFKYAKVSDRKMISDSVHVREIVFGFQGMKQGDAAVAAKFKLIDSVFKAIDSLGADFGMMAAMYSDDPNSKMKGGDIGWVKMGEKEKQYNDLIFYRAQKGKAYRTIVQAEDAVHIVQVVEDRPSKQAVLATYYAASILPSTETEGEISRNAAKFITDNPNKAKFVESGKKIGMRAADRVMADMYVIPGLGSARNLVKWAFQSKEGDISSVSTIDGKLVIAMVDQVVEKGEPNFEAVKEELRFEVLREKKYEMLAKKVNDAKAANIDDLAAKLNKMVNNADKTTFGRPVNGEGVVVATAFSAPSGKLSAPIKGLAGAYVIQPIGVTEPQKPTDFSMFGFMLKQQADQKANMSSVALKKMANIDDYRLEF